MLQVASLPQIENKQRGKKSDHGAGFAGFTGLTGAEHMLEDSLFKCWYWTVPKSSVNEAGFTANPQ